MPSDHYHFPSVRVVNRLAKEIQNRERRREQLRRKEEIKRMHKNVAAIIAKEADHAE